MKLSRKFSFWPTVTTICLLAMSTSLYIGMNQSLWFDEAYSIMVAKQSVGQAVHLASVDTHPPLYYVLLHFWGDLWNWNVFGLRLLSVMAYGGSIAVAALLGRRIFGSKAGMWMAGTIALSPLLMRYGFEIRMYAIASLIGITATYVMVLAIQANARKRYVLWAIYAALVVAGMYLLYYLALLWVAHVLWLLFMTYLKKSISQLHKQPWVWAYIASVVPFLPWLPTFLKQMNNGALAPIGQQMNLENIIGIASFNTVYRPVWQVDIWVTPVVIAALVAVAYIVKQGLKMAKKAERHYLALLTMYILVPVVLLMLVSISRSMYVERYLSHIAIGLMALVGALIALSLRKKHTGTYLAIGIFAFSCVVGVGTLAGVGNYNFQRMAKPEVAAVSEVIGGCKKDTTVVAADPYVYIELAAYLPASCDMYFYSEAQHLGGGYAPLDSSSRQLRNKKLQMKKPTLYYVYYDEPQLTVAPEYEHSVTNTKNNLSITQYVK